MDAIQTGARTPSDRPQHLRLTVQIEGAQLQLLDILVVNEPLDRPKRTVGMWVYEWREGNEAVWRDTMPDPITQRGIARPKEVEHSFGQRQRGDFTVRVPFDRDAAARPVELRVYRSGAALPEDPAALAQILTAGRNQLELVATLGNDAFKRHPQWGRVEAALGAPTR